MSEFLLYMGREKLKPEVCAQISCNIKHFDWVNVQYQQDQNWEIIYTQNKSDEIDIFEDSNHGYTFILNGYICESSDFGEGYHLANEPAIRRQCIIERYHRQGIDGLVGLNGIYHLFVWNKKAKILQVAGDRLGLFQVFFFPLGEKDFILTSNLINLKSICPEKIKINKRGLFDLLFIGNAFEGRTILESAYRILSNASFEVKEGQIRLLTKKKLAFSQQRWNQITPKILDELEYYYKQAVTRYLSQSEKVLYFQSGGRDSRLTSFILRKCGMVPTAVTVGEKHHAEMYIAKRVSQKVGFPWKYVPIKEDFGNDFVEKMFSIDSFSRRYAAPWFYEAFDAETIANHDCCLASFIIHDVMGGPIKKGKLEYSNDDRDAFENYISVLRKGFFSVEQLRRLMGDEAVDFANDYMKEAFELFMSQGEEPYQRLIALDLLIQNRMKIGGNIRSMNAALPIRLPGADIDLMDFIFSLPPTLLYDRELINNFLLMKSKPLAAIPIDMNTCQPALMGSREYLRFQIWKLATYKFLIPLLGIFDVAKATGSFYVQVYSTQGKGFQALQQNALSQSKYVERFINVDLFKRYLSESINGVDHIVSGNYKKSLITAGYALKTFLDANNFVGEET